MTDEQSTFVERMGVLATQAGIPRMAGRLWGWLLICEPPEQNAAELAEALEASRGSISSSTRLLTTVGIIHRSTRRGDRREYFSIPPGAVRTLMDRAQQQLRADREVTEAGLALIADRSAESQARLRDLHDMYAFFEAEWPAVLDRYHQTQTDADRIGPRKEASA